MSDDSSQLPRVGEPLAHNAAEGPHLSHEPSDAHTPASDEYPAKAAVRAAYESFPAAEDGAAGVDARPPLPSCVEVWFGWLWRAFNYVVPKGGMLSGVLNLASQTFGAGIMSVPAAFNSTGLLMCVFYLVVFTVLTIYSLYLLAEVSERTSLKTFEALARGLFGRGGDVFAALVMWLLCFGASTGFVVGVGEILGTLLKHEGTPAYLQTNGGRRCLQAGVWLLFMLPGALPKRVNSLRYISLAGVAFVILVVFSVVGHSAKNAFHGGVRRDLVMVQTGNDGVSGIAIFVFSMLCQGNSFRIYWESNPRSVRRMTITAIISCSICCLLYFLIGFFGYAEFGAAITGNILVLYDPYKEPLFFVCFIGMIVKLIASFGQNMLACRTAFFQVLRWDLDTMPYWQHTIVAGLFAIGALVLGLFVPDIGIVFGLSGGLCGGFMGFIFPALFSMYAGGWTLRKVGLAQYLATYVLLIAGVVAVVFGTASTVFSTVERYR